MQVSPGGIREIYDILGFPTNVGKFGSNDLSYDSDQHVEFPRSFFELHISYFANQARRDLRELQSSGTRLNVTKAGGTELDSYEL
jgi:hypothetical protein